MANIIQFKTEVTSRVVIEISEVEARALNAMTLYGHKAFLEGFYNKLGKSYMQPHEQGIISLFEMIKTDFPKYLRKVDEAKNAIRVKPKTT